MKRTGLAATLAITMGCAVAVSAQTSSTGSGTQAQSGTQSRQPGGNQTGLVTVVGCLQSSDSTANSAEPRSGAGSGRSRYRRVWIRFTTGRFIHAHERDDGTRSNL